MNFQENILSFLDLLDLDEEVIDSRLKSIMARKEFSNKHLIFSEVTLQDETVEVSDDTRAILILKVADSILHTVLKHNKQLYLPFLELSVESILKSLNEKLKIHFLNSTVPAVFASVTGFNILDLIWNYIEQLKGEDRSIALKVLSSLSDYFLPTSDSDGIVLFESNIVNQSQFWHTILYGLLSTDLLLRKLSVYLAKRALDYVNTLKTNVIVESEGNILFQWLHNKSDSLKLMWDNYFILIDSLEEKQSNIVLPSLKIFSSLKDMGHWLNCALNIGLKHDNTQVRLKCIQYRLETKLNSQPEAVTLLEALNDINNYANSYEIEVLKTKFRSYIKDETVFMYIFTSIPTIQWSPVPFYYISSILANKDLENSIKLTGHQTSTTIINILKIPCNNVSLRKAAHINIAYFTAHCCTGLHWRDYANIHLLLPLLYQTSSYLDDPFVSLIKDMVRKEDKESFCEFLLETHLNINFGLLYFLHHKEDLSIYIEILLEKFKKIDDISSRQYSDKRDCLHDVIYLTQLIRKLNTIEHAALDTLNVVILAKFKTVLFYILNLLLSNTILSLKDIILVNDGLYTISNAKNIEHLKEDLLQLYKASLLFIKDKNVALENVVLCLHIMHSLTNSAILLSNYKHEMLALENLLVIIENFKSKQSMGKLRNAFYEKSCEIVFTMLDQKEIDIEKHADHLVKYIEVVLDCGGYGCLRLCLKILVMTLPYVIAKSNININLGQLVFRMWKEIEELKSNNQYTPCIEEFVNLITHEQLLKIPDYNNTVILYCKKIIDFSAVKVTPLYYLISKLNNIVFTKDYGHVIYILSEVLMYSPVPRKDQRITENLMVEVLQEPRYGFDRAKFGSHFNFEIQYLSVLALSKIKDLEILSTIEKFIRNKIDDVFKNKTRYHGHSQAHRLLLAGIQHLLLISLMKVDHLNTSMETLNWCIELLGKLPHQISVRICLEWYIALHLDIMEIGLDDELLRNLYDVPLTSKLLVLYWTVKPLITRKKDSNSRGFEFVMDFLLSHTMGQMFNTRLHAQYLAAKLYSISYIFAPKYPFIMTVIKRTLGESENEKNYMKMKNDYFANDFDIIQDLTPSFVYYFLPRYCDADNNETVDINFVRNTLKEINSNITVKLPSTSFHKEWISSYKKDDEVFSLKLNKNEGNKILEEEDVSGTIQKKYVPWRNMTDVYAYEMEKKKENKSELIVVASLIDKLPNLGGMARTSEVFGVKTYVVDSLRHLQDKQFQSLSVSAERWIDVEEVRPGPPLKQYLMAKKSEGYSVVAAEQTSTSVKLQDFQFPVKTLLLLGHEKEGIPCDLLPMMDYCVEIPQQGFVRSLNVHVTAAIFVWEYARQNIL
ncbi:hypothetical protein evm_000491 [Chilo suppressalis]|nr:hypothetical protein evm_000491 [Chilo suppressalis]